MKKTLSQAKKDFKEGRKFVVVTNNFKSERVGAIGTITKVFSSKFEYLDSLTNKTFTFYWGNAKENIYNDDILTYINLDNSIGFEFKLL